MQVYLFNSRQEPAVLAFSTDSAGTNLPASLGPWIPLGDRQISEHGVDGIGNSDVIGATIETVGYYIARAQITLIHEPVRPNH